jgi:hypothetical protein
MNQHKKIKLALHSLKMTTNLEVKNVVIGFIVQTQMQIHFSGLKT